MKSYMRIFSGKKKSFLHSQNIQPMSVLSRELCSRCESHEKSLTNIYVNCNKSPKTISQLHPIFLERGDLPSHSLYCASVCYPNIFLYDIRTDSLLFSEFSKNLISNAIVADHVVCKSHSLFAFSIAYSRLWLRWWSLSAVGVTFVCTWIVIGVLLIQLRSSNCIFLSQLCEIIELIIFLTLNSSLANKILDTFFLPYHDYYAHIWLHTSFKA